MKEELTTKMHSEFTVTKDVEIKHKAGCVIDVAISMNKNSVEDVTDIASLYGVTYADVIKWKPYWGKLGLKL